MTHSLDIPLTDATLYDLYDFELAALANEVTDRDGHGFYATITEDDPHHVVVSDVPAVPYKVVQQGLEPAFTHVVWYNK